MALNRGTEPHDATELDGIRMNDFTESAEIYGRCIHLTRQQRILLRLLLVNPGVCVTTSALCRAAGVQPSPGHINLQNAISRLRSRLGDTPCSIEAVTGHGYRVRIHPSTKGA